MIHVALLLVRLTVGGLLAGHGAQKLFGSFGGRGIEGTGGWLESIGLRPGRPWAGLAGLSEFGGGLLTVLGLLNPIGPILSLGAMLMATVKVHAGRPIWATEGGAELPVTNMAVQGALIVAGPGRLSLDRLFGIRLSRWLAIPGLAAVIGVVAWANRTNEADDVIELGSGQELQDETSDAGAAAITGSTAEADKPAGNVVPPAAEEPGDEYAPLQGPAVAATDPAGDSDT